MVTALKARLPRRPSLDPLFWATIVGCSLAVAVGASTLWAGYWLLVPVAVLAGVAIAYLAWSRLSERYTLTGAPISPNFALMGMPTILSLSFVSFTAGFALLVLTLIVLLFWQRDHTSRFYLSGACAIIPIAALLIILRPNYPSTMSTAAFFVVGCVTLARAVYLSRNRTSAVVSLVDGVGIYLVVSVGLWVAGFGATQSRTGGLENALTGGDRVLFPLANSLASTPAMAGLYLAAATPLMILLRRHLLLRVIPLASAVAILILSDTRVSLVGAVLLALFVIWAPRAFRVSAPWLVGGTLIVPFIYSSIQMQTQKMFTSVTDIFPWLSRSGEETASLNQRDYIWSQSLHFYSERTNWVDQMLGFGAYGHAESGASQFYYWRFGGLGRDDRLMTPHNSTLQLLLDGGWVVTALIGGCLVAVAILLARHVRQSVLMTPALAMLVVLAIVSITEIALSPAHAQPTWWVFLTLALIAFARDESQDENQTTSPLASSQTVPSNQIGLPKVVS
ncbi:O-antigen ligase [Gordonia sp. SCSIO 19800]|uniref:O-antigen ligase family protein n=1 Tax=Gordonia sp. SCSIO 19800 TaxID=2826926 RepID=UPI001B832345|nr:O-antigen ligase family protein [Gordonia sp. SCSIO 19800]MBR7191555.1 O-antigen ligase family protein [Gordonia sp. SCSIO 19800]